MSAYRFQWIVSPWVMGLLAVCDSQARWLKGRIYIGLPANALTNPYSTNLLGQLVFRDFPTAEDRLPVLPLTGPFTAETQTKFFRIKQWSLQRQHLVLCPGPLSE